jgi:hypothetical protein
LLLDGQRPRTNTIVWPATASLWRGRLTRNQEPRAVYSAYTVAPILFEGYVNVAEATPVTPFEPTAELLRTRLAAPLAAGTNVRIPAGGDSWWVAAVATRVRESAILKGSAGWAGHRRSATMQIRRTYISPVVAAAAEASTGAAPRSAIVPRSGSAVPVSLGAVGVPVYSHTEVLIGSAIVLTLCLVVLVTLAVGWWRMR